MHKTLLGPGYLNCDPQMTGDAGVLGGCAHEVQGLRRVAEEWPEGPPDPGAREDHPAFFFPPNQSETIVGGSYYVAPATIKPLYRVHKNCVFFFVAKTDRISASVPRNPDGPLQIYRYILLDFCYVQ